MPSDTSINVALTIETGPVITTEPVNQTACVGSPVSFSVIATGSSLTYQWRRGIVNLVDGVAISGATTSVLTIDPVSVLDFANDYNVVITGACAPNATSINVSLTVGTGPVITTEPVNQTACIGDLVSFSVVATGSGLSYQWRKGTIDLIDGVSISGATTDILTIDPVSALDAATDYNVVVSGSCAPNDTSIFVSLTVGTSPTIASEPVDQSVCIGDSATFSVVASGNGLNYQWRKGLVDLVDGANISGATTDTLTIYPVSALDVATDYNVVISGGCAPDVTSVNVSLEIGASTVITTVPVSQTVCEGDSVSFIVVASGSNLSYQWRRGTVNLVNGGNISGATSDTLTINPATLSDVATNYNVVISGGCDPTNTLDTDLNSADGFGILAATAITSTGFTEIHNLNVGLYPGVRSSITGFPPAIVVNGAIYAADDVAPPGVAAMLIQAKQDLTDAYLFAEGASAPAPATVAGDQGGLTLAPGIYKSTSTLLIQSGDLTLDAQGDSNAVWIFQIASDFTTIGGAGGNVILSNGALARNVYWQVGSSATIGNGTSFKGTILALTSITMNTGSSIEGRLLARNGAVVLSGTNMITYPTDSVTSIISTTSVNVSLAVNTAPIIITEPISQTACAGDSVSFTVVATGSVLTYQWRKGTVNLIDGGSISGATTDTLTINPVSTLDDATDYNVVITGDCAPNDTSINVSLTVNDSTLIITEPMSQTACIGDSVSFVVVASGSNLSYQWRIGNTNIIGATNDTLTINPVGLTDIAIDYNVIVTGLCAPADSSVYVSLLGGTSPVITTQPVSQTVCAGGLVSFTVTATGFGLTYQWRKGLFDLSNAGNVSGVTTSTLTINPAQLSDTSNSYYVVVSGSCLPSDTSVFVSLNVDTSIVILSEPINQIACSGSSVSFTVSAIGSGLSFQWRNGLNDVLDGATISGATTDTLTINPVSLADASSNYYVVLTGVCLSDTSISVSLIVDTATNVTTEPIDQTVCEGNSVSFSVVATGTAISYQWRTGPTDVINSASVSGATTNTLTINPVQISVTPLSYYVVVTGTCLPNDTSIEVTLTINLNPVSIATSNSPVCVGNPVEFYAQTETNASYLWNGPNGYISTAQNPVIVSAVLADAGAYSLIVSVVGCTSDTSAITLEINNCVATVELHIPEGFSPDNDGINDVFFIRGLENYPNNSVDIYNRWGNKVFSASPYMNNWDGTSQNNLSVGGDKLPTGTYFILFNLGDDSDIYKGTIYLNRSN
jgi:gliding motility-associated-like protein